MTPAIRDTETQIYRSKDRLVKLKHLLKQSRRTKSYVAMEAVADAYNDEVIKLRSLRHKNIYQVKK